jgi:hypothetical protein
MIDRERALLSREEEVASLEEGAHLKLVDLQQREADLAIAMRDAMEDRIEELVLFHDLASRAFPAIHRLDAEDFCLPANMEDSNPASYLHLFTEITEQIHVAAVSMDGVVEEECRDLLRQAGMRVFVNLLRRDSAFDFGQVLEPLETPLDSKLIVGVQDSVGALLDLYMRRDATTGEEDSEDEDPSDEGSSAQGVGDGSPGNNAESAAPPA